MKKVALSLAGVLAAAAFAPEASALPTFARQTNSACNACHFQHFPLLNSFGRAFKAGAYTMTAVSKVEGEHLSIPSNLNFGALVTAGLENSTGNSTNIFIPGNGGEMQLFWGGRINDFAGFLSELGTTGPAGGQGKILILPEISGDVRAGLSIFSIGQDPAASFELLNTGATSIHRLMGSKGFGGGTVVNAGTRGSHIEATSARQYVAPELGGAGASVVVVNPNMFSVVASKYLPIGPMGFGGTQGAGLPFQYLRGTFMFDLAGFDSAVGIQNWSGTTNNAAILALALAATPNLALKATVVDAQFQGEAAGMPVGIYTSYGTSGASTAVEANAFNAGVATRSSFNVAAEVGVIPGHATVQAAFRVGKSGAGAVAGDGDNAIMVGATYELSMNQELTFHYTTQSGSSWNAPAAQVGKNQYTLLLETLF